MNPGASLILQDQLRVFGPVRSPLWASEPLVENPNGAGTGGFGEESVASAPSRQGTRDTPGEQ